jgi:hypothetical protein
MELIMEFEERKWWSIGRGRQDSKEKTKGKENKSSTNSKCNVFLVLLSSIRINVFLAAEPTLKVTSRQTKNLGALSIRSTLPCFSLTQPSKKMPGFIPEPELVLPPCLPACSSVPPHPPLVVFSLLLLKTNPD